MGISTMRCYVRMMTFVSSLAVLVGLGSLSGSALASPMQTQVPATQNGLTVTKPVTENANGAAQKNFSVGASIKYAYTLDNSTGKTIIAEFQYYAYWGTVDEQPNEIISHILKDVSVPPGTHKEAPLDTIRAGALPGFYSLQVTISDQNNPADITGAYGSFNVTGSKTLNVPAYTQFQPKNLSESEDCGPTSVAMTLAYYKKSSAGATNAQQQIHDVRTVIAGDPNDIPTDAPDPNTTGPTDGPELGYALTHYGATYSEISENSSVQIQVAEMAAEVQQKFPVIAFINANNLVPDRHYGGHFLVVVGFKFSGGLTWVLVNDPDQSKLPGYAQPMAYNTFENALTGAIPLGNYSIAGISVTG